MNFDSCYLSTKVITGLPRTWLLDHFFLRDPWGCFHPQPAGSNMERTVPLFPREKVVWVVFGYLVGHGCMFVIL